MVSSVDPEVFRNFAFYGALLAAKMLPMGMLTARQRFKKGVSIYVNMLQKIDFNHVFVQFIGVC